MDAKLDIDALTESIKAFALTKIAEHIKATAKDAPEPSVKLSTRYKEDAEYAEKVRTAARERFHKLSKEEPDQINQRSNERYKNDPEYREKKRLRAKERSAKLWEDCRAAKAKKV
jgi:hypothetical protein